jgi:hypothetical protein
MLHYENIVKIGYNVNKVILDMPKFFETLQDLHQLQLKDTKWYYTKRFPFHNKFPHGLFPFT